MSYILNLLQLTVIVYHEVIATVTKKVQELKFPYYEDTVVMSQHKQQNFCLDIVCTTYLVPCVCWGGGGGGVVNI